MTVRLTALGNFIGIVPVFTDLESGRYMVVSFDKRGNWKAGSVHDTEEEAKAKRTELFALHRKLAKARERRSRT